MDRTRGDLLVRVLGLQSLLLGLVPELREPLEEQRVRAGGHSAFATQPDRLRSWHHFGSDEVVMRLAGR